MRLYSYMIALLLCACGDSNADSVVIGKACMQNSDCTSIEHGYCSIANVCSLACTRDSDCGVSAICDRVHADGVCKRSCTQNSDCEGQTTCMTSECL